MSWALVIITIIIYVINRVAGAKLIIIVVKCVDKMLENNNNNKVAIVTGASSGIGYATSLALSRAGVSVAAGARRIDRLQELEKQIIKNGDDGRGGVGEEILIRKK